MRNLFIEEGGFIGVVGVDIDAKLLYDQISKTSIYETGFASMMSRDGEIKYSPKILYIEQDDISKIINSDSIEGITYLDKRRKMTVMAQKLRYGDYLIISIANEDLYESEQRVTFTSILITMIVSLFIIAVMSGVLYRLFQQFKTDTMTKVGNCSTYMEEISDIDLEIRTGNTIRYAMVVFDINGLKQVNDKLGHAAGTFVEEKLLTPAEKKVYEKTDKILNLMENLLV